MAHLWLRGGIHPDWIAEDVWTLRCCEMYGCRPSELLEEDWYTVLRHRQIKAAEAMYLEADTRENARFRSLKRGR